MQIMPKTGRSLKVGDIKITEPNIHAGAKYLDLLMTNYFSDACFSEQDRSLFAFASYNAGPGRISRMRTLAKERGLDANRWFNNVELVTAEKVGFETTAYVRNIYKYYVAYKLTINSMEEKQKSSSRPLRIHPANHDGPASTPDGTNGQSGPGRFLVPLRHIPTRFQHRFHHGVEVDLLAGRIPADARR